MKILPSNEDNSVNFIIDNKNDKNQILEARYVRRVDDYFIIYVSSHTGCKLACRFCHLTATGQTSFQHASLNDYKNQADIVMDYYNKLNKPARHVHFNFMARGEPLANDIILNDGHSVINYYYELAKQNNLIGSSRLSSIMPKTIKKSLVDIIGTEHVIPYYSLYSINDKFRKRWIPNALPVLDALDILKDWQNKSKQHIVIHGAFIKDENDSIDDMEKLCDILIEKKIYAKMNVVRYNPFNVEKHGQETSEERINILLDIFKQRLQENNLLARNSRVVPRVGFDVKASCGMFINE